MITEVITSGDIYWITRLTGIKALFAISALACIITAIVNIVSSSEMNSYTQKTEILKRTERSKKFFFTAFLCASGVVFTPSTTDAVIMKVIPAIANNSDLQGIGKDMIDLTKDWLNELKPSHIKENK